MINTHNEPSIKAILSEVFGEPKIQLICLPNGTKIWLPTNLHKAQLLAYKWTALTLMKNNSI